MRPEKLIKRIEKLPQWARRYITKLEKDVEHWKAQFEVAEAGDSPIQWYVLFDEPQGLPAGASIILTAADGGKVRVELRQGSVRARAHNGSLVIEPEASNAITLNVRR